jgi:hypothetical protein
MASNDSSKIKAEEERIAQQAADAATSYVHQKMRSSDITIRNKGSKGRSKRNKHERKPIIDATYIKPEMGEHRLLGFKFMSNRVGFVHHFGVIADNTRYLRTHSKTGNTFKQAKPSLGSQSYFDDIYKNSGALKILEDGLAKTRTRAITVQLQNMIFKIDKQNG